MKALVLAIGLFCCAGIARAQQKLNSFEELYSYLEKEYIDKSASFLASVEEGMYKMCHYQNIQTATIKQRLEPIARLTGRSVSKIFIDSMFTGVKTILIPGKYAKEFRLLEKELQFFSEQYCGDCAAHAKGAYAIDKLNYSIDCLRKKIRESDMRDSIAIKSYPADPRHTENAFGAYIFIHCPLFSELLQQHLYNAIPGDEDINDVESLLFEKIRALRGYWKRRSLDSLSGIFPAYEQYTIQLEKALTATAALKSEYEIKRNASRQPVLEYTTYTGRGNSLKIVNRVVYTFSSASASSVFSSIEIIPFEKIPRVKQLQQQMRENTKANIRPAIKSPPPKRKS